MLASNYAIDCPPTPAAPWLAFTRLKASQTSRLGILNGFASSTRSSRFQLASDQGRTTQTLRSHGWSGLRLVPSRRRRDEAQVLTFHTKAWSSFAPPTCRMPLGPYQGIPRADPGGRVTPRF